MRRTLKENVDNMPTLYLNDSAVLADYPRHDMNNLRDILEDLGAETDGIVVNGETFMVINGLDKETVLDEMTKHGIDELEDDEYLSYEEPIEDEEQVVAEDEDNSFEDEDALNESEDILDDAKSELRGLLAKLSEEETYVWDSDDPLVLDEYFDDYDEQFEVYSIDAEGNIETQHGIVNAFDLTDSDDIYSICDDIREMDEKDYPDYEDVEDVEDVEDDEDELPHFEKLKHHRRLEEKKGGCCPGLDRRRNNKLNEALKAHQEKDQKKLDKIESNVKKVLDDINNNYITMHDAVEALNKLKEENKKLNKIEKNEKEKFTLNDVKGVNKALDKIGQVNPTKREEIDKLKKLMDKVNESVDAKKKCLHENVQINGKSISKFSIQQLKDVMNKLNESDAEKYAKLINYLDEEITYRITLNRCEAKQARKALLEARAYAKAKALNEAEDGSVSDEELQKMFGEPQGSKESEGKEDTKKKGGEDNEEEETEEVELTRIVITLKNQEAAEELKQACLDAEIPEDAIEIEEVKDEESEESSEDEENTDEGKENAEESEESAENESYNYSNIRNLLFEGENEENSEDEESNEENTEGKEKSEEDEEKTEEDEVNVKLILTNTDYAEKLADVLDKVYGITKEEFEEMIGGEIVREGEEDEEVTEEDEKDEKKDEESEESSADAYKPEELFQGL